MPIIIPDEQTGGEPTDPIGGGSGGRGGRALPALYNNRRPSNIEACWFEPDDGDEVDLSTLLDYSQFKQGLNGRFLAPVEHVISQTPSGAGWYRGTRRGLGALTLPLLITGETPDELRWALLDLAQTVSVGPGWLNVETTWGTHRRIRAIYESGIEDDPATDGNEVDFMVSLVWRALSSFWEPPEPIEGVVSANESNRSFFPGPPWILGETSVFTSWSENNEGDEKAWPVVTVLGPAFEIVVRNERSGMELRFPGMRLGDNDELTIDMRPQHKTMFTASGFNVWPVAQGDMFSLLKGKNQMTVQALETSSRTRITVSYFPQFKGV